MTQVVTVSATTAAYAAEAVKPSARVRGDGPTDEAITLLSVGKEPPRHQEAISAIRSALPLALMLISANRRPPQESEAEALRRYLEYMEDEESGDQQGSRPDENPAEDEGQQSDEIAEMLDRFIQGK
ncbi:hypothetical protein M728_001497 [Ensifer sp. WSM1721]|uniref:hypothetical protein n=1 Tax=Ensifer sp. WSM1721 TaxID=1041159 RepID=UPI000478C533|nr:hypothetical protein [Ensifer sp. WSM1721]